MMLTFILPRLARMFEDFQASLPLPTRILLGICRFPEKILVADNYFFGANRSPSCRESRREEAVFFPALNITFLWSKALFTNNPSRISLQAQPLLLKSGVILLSALKITGAHSRQARIRQTVRTGLPGYQGRGFFFTCLGKI